MATVNIAGLDKAEVLAALHNGTRSVGLGRLSDLGRQAAIAEAQTLIDSRKGDLYFDYVGGRPIKADISGDEFDPWLYDRDAGQGAAERAIESIRAKATAK